MLLEEVFMRDRIKVAKIVTVAAVAFLFLLVISLCINLVKLTKASANERRLEAELARLNECIERNDATIDELKSEEYLDWYAREYLNMKGKDEEAFKPKDN